MHKAEKQIINNKEFLNECVLVNLFDWMIPNIQKFKP